MNDQNSLHRELKEQEFSSSSLKLLEAGEAGYETGTDTDEGEEESRCGRSRSVASVRHGRALLLLRIFLFIFFFALFLVFGEKVVRKWRGARSMAEGGVDGCGCVRECESVALSYIGAAEMAQGRGRWRKWRGAVAGDGSGAGPWLVTEVARGRRFSAFCSDAHGLLPASSPLSLFRFLPLQADRFPPCWFKLVQHARRGPRETPSRGGTLARLSSSRSETSSPSSHPREATSPREAFSLHRDHAKSLPP